MLGSSARATARRQAKATAEQAEQAATAGHRYDTAKAALTALIPDFDRAHAGQLGHVNAAGQAVINYRDHGDLDRAVDDYDYATRRRFLPRLLGPNRYPDRCAAHVPTETRD